MNTATPNPQYLAMDDMAEFAAAHRWRATATPRGPRLTEAELDARIAERDAPLQPTAQEPSP